MVSAQTTDHDQDAEERAYEERERARHDARVGLVVADRYKILRTLGAGGMGAVYEAEHEAIGRKVALKCLHSEYARDPDVVTRFRREARAATAIGNEHIIDVTDVGALPDGAPFIVMELLAGSSLAAAIEREGPFSIRRAVHVARQICDALAAAHEKGIVHRDLKPDNVFLVKRGSEADFVKVLDFGISKTHAKEAAGAELTRTGMALGTPSYMSPEQAQGLRDVDGRTDVWALGVILYEMLTKTRPFMAETYPMLLMRIVGGVPTPVSEWRRDVPAALDALIMRCLEKPVATRVASMRELDTALAAFAQLDSSPELVAAAGPTSGGDLAYARTAEQPSDPRVSSGVRATAALGTEANANAPRTRFLVASAVIFLIAASGMALFAMQRPAEATTIEPPAVPVAAPPPALPLAPPVVEVTPVEVGAIAITRRIESTPPGATIELGGVAIGTTPMDLELPDGAPVEITLRLTGRRSVTRAIEPGETPISVPLETVRRSGSRLPELAPH